jgi:hypothetical protein
LGQAMVASVHLLFLELRHAVEEREHDEATIPSDRQAGEVN